MDQPMSDLGFKLMALVFRVRDFLRPRMALLQEAGIEPGFCVLDYGCGPGSYIAPLAALVSPTGRIVALDIHPMAAREVAKKAARKGIENVETIVSDGHTGLAEACVNVVLLYDVFHDLSRPDDTLRELHRVLKPGGTLSVSDHHMKEPDILAKVTRTGQFQLLKKGRKTWCFSKAGENLSNRGQTGS